RTGADILAAVFRLVDQLNTPDVYPMRGSRGDTNTFRVDAISLLITVYASYSARTPNPVCMCCLRTEPCPALTRAVRRYQPPVVGFLAPALFSSGAGWRSGSPLG